jgi:hypothetical protein
MKLTDFFEKIKAELVGGKYKAVVDGTHHFVAESVDGQAVLTAVGKEVMANLPDEVASAAPVVAQVAVAAAGAAMAGAPVGDAVAVALAPVATAAATAIATDAVDAILQGVKPKAKKAAQ